MGHDSDMISLLSCGTYVQPFSMRMDECLSQMISGDFIQISSYNNEHGIGRCHGRSRFPFKNWPFSGQGVIVLLSTIASSLFLQ